MDFFNRFSLKVKILSIVILVIASLTGASTYFIRHMKNAGEKSLDKNFESYAEGLQAAVAAQFFERYGDVQAFALNPILLSSDRSEITSLLNSYITLYGIYDLILVVNKEGKLIAANTTSFDGKELRTDELYQKDFSNEGWFKATLTGQFSEDKNAGFAGTYVEDALIDPYTTLVSGKQTFGNSFSSQIKDEKGSVIGVISNRAGSRWWEGEVTNLYSTLSKNGFEKIELTVLNKNGEIITDYDPSSNNGALEIKHNFDVIGKLNLVSAGVEAARLATTGNTGVTLSFHARKKINQIAGFSFFYDKKFLKSLGWSALVRGEASHVYSETHKTWGFFLISSSIILIIMISLTFVFTRQLSNVFLKLSDNLQGTSTQTASASAQLSSVSQSLSSSASEAAASLEETVASIEELNSMVAKNTENSKEASALSQSCRSSAEKGETEMASLSVAIGDISTSSQKISEITNVIDDIAFQTNLLALNAAVEAARAGEQGKGFAVVAEAVRGLAQRSAVAAKDISSLIKDSVEKVERGSQIAKHSSSVLNEIVQNVKKVADINSEIASASQEQSMGISQISKAMNQLDQATQKNASASEESAASAGELSAQVVVLNELIKELNSEVSGKTKKAKKVPGS
jgi:methyl-accepting chemotaxis protein